MRVWAAALCLTVLGALAGCADDGDDPDGAPAATVTETVTASPTPSEATTAPSEPTPTSTGTASSAPTESTSTEPDLSQPPITYEEAEAHIAAARQSGGERELDRFQSADEQFYCSFGERYIRPSCEILDGIEDPTTCGSSMATKVGRIELTKRGWRPFCNTDTVRQPGATVLEQGGVATWSEEGVGCVLEPIGLTCVDTAGRRGFFLAPGRYQLF